jgi:putative endonuclease
LNDLRNENNRGKGSAYEEEAASFFITKNYTILARNYRTKTGEIDLVVRDPADGCIVFVEVKYRRSTRKGMPFEAVTPAKQQRIRRTAEWYVRENRLGWNRKYRYDVLSILNGEISHIRNAFGGF